jgi:hypothetical protein
VWDSESFWSFWKRDQFLTLGEIGTPNHPAHIPAHGGLQLGIPDVSSLRNANYSIPLHDNYFIFISSILTTLVTLVSVNGLRQYKQGVARNSVFYASLTQKI